MRYNAIECDKLASKLQQINLEFYCLPVFVHFLFSQIPSLEKDLDYVLKKFLFSVEVPVDAGVIIT